MSPSIGLSHLEAALNNLYCWPVAYVTHLYSLSLLLPFGFCWVKPVFLWELYHYTIGSQSVWGTMTYRHASLPQLQYMVGECLVGHTLISDYKLLSTTIKKFQAIPVLPMDYGNGRPSWKLWTSSSRRSNSQLLAARSWHCGCHKNRRVLWRHRRWREVPWLHRILRSGGLKWGETQRHGDNRNTTKEEDGIWPETIVYPAICNLLIYIIYIYIIARTLKRSRFQQVTDQPLPTFRDYASFAWTPFVNGLGDLLPTVTVHSRHSHWQIEWFYYTFYYKVIFMGICGNLCEMGRRIWIWMAHLHCVS